MWCSKYAYKNKEKKPCILPGVKMGKKWKHVDACYENNTYVFAVSQVPNSFCVISVLKTESQEVLTTGARYQSRIEQGVAVTFPPNAVSSNQTIGMKLNPVDMECIKRKGSLFGLLTGISSCLLTNHIEFKKAVDVELPVSTVYSVEECNNSTDFLVFRLKEDMTLSCKGLTPVIDQEGKAKIVVESFSGYIIVRRTSLTSSTSSISMVLEEALSLKKFCKILFFVRKDKRTQRSITILLECVEKERIAEVAHNRQELGFEHVSQWQSKDLFLNPDKTIISVDVRGKFAIPKSSGIKYPRITFIPVAEDNYTRFQVDMNPSAGGEIYGVLSFRDRRGIIDEIYYDPKSTKQLPPNLKIRHDITGRHDEVLNFRHAQTPSSGSPSTGTPSTGTPSTGTPSTGKKFTFLANYNETLTLKNAEIARPGSRKPFVDKNTFSKPNQEKSMDDRIDLSLVKQPEKSVDQTKSKEQNISESNNKPRELTKEEAFFNDRGLMAIVNVLTMEQMYDIFINMNMSDERYAEINDDILARRKLLLLKAAIKYQPENSKISNLLIALNASNQKPLAEKIKKIWDDNDDLHNIST